MTIRLTTQIIDHARLLESAQSPASGAVVLFLGTVRELSDGRNVSGLTYDAYPSMAEAKLREVVGEACQRWPLQHLSVEHRYGPLSLGDVAVAVVAASAHRAPAFEAAQWTMDTIKTVVPIWKKEHWIAGDADWVHPAAAERPDLAPEDASS